MIAVASISRVPVSFSSVSGHGRLARWCPPLRPPARLDHREHGLGLDDPHRDRTVAEDDAVADCEVLDEIWLLDPDRARVAQACRG